MRTDDLIDALSAEPPSRVRAGTMGRLTSAAAIGAIAAVAAVILWLGPRPDLHLAMRGGFFWIKLAYAASLAVSGLALVDRYGRPDGRGGWRWTLVFAPIVILAIIALAASASEDAQTIHRDWMGRSWSLCPVRILVLAVPTFLAALWAFRRWAPTRLALAGFAAGLWAGGVSAAAYCLACEESAALFVVTWYTLGVFACGGLGAVLGPRLLRW
jgi:hypothetical protein